MPLVDTSLYNAPVDRVRRDGYCSVAAIRGVDGAYPRNSLRRWLLARGEEVLEVCEEGDLGFVNSTPVAASFEMLIQTTSRVQGVLRPGSRSTRRLITVSWNHQRAREGGALLLEAAIHPSHGVGRTFKA